MGHGRFGWSFEGTLLYATGARRNLSSCLYVKRLGGSHPGRSLRSRSCEKPIQPGAGVADRAIDAPARRQRPGSTENGNGLRGAGGLVAAVVPVTPGRLLKKSSRSVIKLSGALLVIPTG